MIEVFDVVLFGSFITSGEEDDAGSFLAWPFAPVRCTRLNRCTFVHFVWKVSHMPSASFVRAMCAVRACVDAAVLLSLLTRVLHPFRGSLARLHSRARTASLGVHVFHLSASRHDSQ